MVKAAWPMVSVPDDVADGVVRIDCRAGGDRVGTGMAAGRNRGKRGQRGQAGRRVAVDQARVAGGQCGQRAAVGHALAVGGDCQCRLPDGQRAADVADGVVRIDCRAGGDGVGTGMAAGRHRGKRGQRAQAGRRVAVDQARVAGRERGQRAAVGHALAVGGDGQGRLADGQRAADVADGVVRIDRRAGGDGVGAGMAAGRNRGKRGQRAQAGRRVAVDQARVAGRERGQRAAVGHALAVGRDGQGRLADGERAADVADRVVGIDRRAGGDGVGPGMAAGRNRGKRGQRGQAGWRVAVDQARVAGRERGQRAAVGHALAVGRDGQGHLADGERAADVADGVVGIDRRAGGDGVGPGMAAGRNRGKRGQRGQAGWRVAIDQARVAGRERGQRAAVGHALVVGGDGQGRLADGERAADVADGVVRIDRRAGGDRVGPGVAAGRNRGKRGQAWSGWPACRR